MVVHWAEKMARGSVYPMVVCLVAYLAPVWVDCLVEQMADTSVSHLAVSLVVLTVARSDAQRGRRAVDSTAALMAARLAASMDGC